MFVANEKGSRTLGRRTFLLLSGGALAALVFHEFDVIATHAVQASDKPGKMVTIVEFADDGTRKGVVTVPRIYKTDAEWKKQLSYPSFQVARNSDTERPFSGALLNVHDKGIFRCICCDAALFNSNTKFESGTGWPSFWQPIAKENVVEIRDISLGMVRTAVSCTQCDAHLGHVFDDGPRPTGLRYCMNSVSLRFAKAS